MMYEDLVERRRWVAPKQFNRILGIYQALPGPEATELAVYFGYKKRGRWGGLLAGLGFVLPGFVLMLILSWAYVAYGTQWAGAETVLYGVKAVVIGVLLHALVRIGIHVYTAPLWILVGLFSLVVSLLWGVNLAVVALGGGVAAWGWRWSQRGPARSNAWMPPMLVAGLPLINVGAWLAFGFFFLKAGLLTFGGAYTVLPFLQEGAVDHYHWLTNEQFLDGVALGGLLPAPLIIVATFVGYVAGGFLGAVLATFLIFLPAFLFTLAGFPYIARLVEQRAARDFFDGVTAAVVALIALVAYRLSFTALPDASALLIATIGFLSLRVFHANVAYVILGGGALGALVQSFRLA